MQSLRDYIIKADFDFSDNFTTESGITLYASKRFTQDKLSNKIVTVVSCPALNADNEILKPGYEIVVDPTIYYQQNYNKTGDQDGPMVVDRRKGLYRMEPSMIILYRESENDEWKGFGRNLLVEKITQHSEKKLGNLVISVSETTDKYFVRYANTEMELLPGDEVYINNKLAVPYWFDNKELLWMNNRDILAKVV